jgi:hypothetical protein
MKAVLEDWELYRLLKKKPSRRMVRSQVLTFRTKAWLSFHRPIALGNAGLEEHEKPAFYLIDWV